MNYAELTREELEHKRDKRLKFMGYRLGTRAWLSHRNVYDACVDELIRRDLAKLTKETK
jgi:hypothetical protein